MYLQNLPDGWMSFDNGTKWRCKAPSYFCEVQNEKNIPVFNDRNMFQKIREIRNFYSSRMKDFGLLNSGGYALDILVANAFAESSGTVPSSLNTPDLQLVFDNASGDIYSKADYTVRYVKSLKNTKGLVRFEPGYQNPVSTPNRVSLGAHQQLISTAAWLNGINQQLRAEDVKELILKLPTNSRFAAQLAIVYFNKMHSRHLNQPPLLAACYNAGSLRTSKDNIWNLRCTGDHIDRWVKYFNMSRQVVSGSVATTTSAPLIEHSNLSGQTVIPPLSSKSINTENKISIESVLSALKRKNYHVREADDKEYNLNLIGIRNNKARVNYFDDFLFVFWKFKGQWFSKIYNITTYPGLTYLSERLVNRKGTAILKEGQYHNSHRVGTHHKSKPPAKQYEALIQVGNLSVYRDKNLDSKFDLLANTIETGNDFAVNIHRAKPGGVTENIGAFSAGCQVFADFQQWNEFHSLFKEAEKNWESSFTYTLINWMDLL